MQPRLTDAQHRALYALVVEGRQRLPRHTGDVLVEAGLAVHVYDALCEVTPAGRRHYHRTLREGQDAARRYLL